ncbi:hypothetical protein DKM44_12645 [Deinococcus irradiatisoli]|uniref:Tyr recombinase domain-containing protein n=1 Tax=Deinococcus irradiatisoli TaxID=2202254 RepID=A0A2Z3JK62_9DEIO|nr:site-specific integrase [Deinococcus irradiatisoli]AWN23971.1 hypothetical protein DKM44_12645 [Deinococcus irradiatisoli]
MHSRKKRLGKATVSSVSVQVLTPKSKASRRTTVLSRGTVKQLREQKASQERQPQQAAEAWEDHGFVFTTVTGAPVRPDALAKAFEKLAQRAGVPRIRFHDMRHTAASLMISQGIPPKTVSEWLGHSDVAFTLRTYTQLYDEQREEAVFDITDLITEK